MPEQHNVVHLSVALKEKIKLHNGEVFKTKEEHEAYMRGINHACTSIGIWLENLTTNARIPQDENSVS